MMKKMNGFMKCLFVGSFLSLLIAILFFTIVYAQKGGKAGIGSLTIDKIIVKLDTNDPEAEKNMLLLTDYSQCRAALKNDANECNRLGSISGVCAKHYNKIQGFFGSLLSLGKVTPDALAICGLGDRETCKTIGEAFLKKDPLLCDTLKSDTEQLRCKAIVKLDRTTKMKDMAVYIEALSTVDKGTCAAIQDAALKRECEAYTTGDETICEECEGAKQFKQIYSDKLD